MESAIMNQIIGAIISVAIMYVGFINKMRSQISVLESEVGSLKHRQDSHSKKNDDIINLITDFKLEMAKKMGDVSVQMGKIQSDVENITSTIADFDAGVVSKKRKR